MAAEKATGVAPHRSFDLQEQRKDLDAAAVVMEMYSLLETTLNPFAKWIIVRDFIALQVKVIKEEIEGKVEFTA